MKTAASVFIVGFAVALSGCTTGPAHRATGVSSALGATSAPGSSSAQPTRHPPGCRRSQFALDYRGGGYAGQAVYGFIVVRDTSEQGCSLSGPITVAGLDRSGNPIRLGQLAWNAPVTSLSPNAARWATGQPQPAGEHVLILQMQGWATNQATGGAGPCDAVTPASWRVALPAGSLVVANADPGLRTEQGIARSLYGCQHHITSEGFISTVG